MSVLTELQEAVAAAATAAAPSVVGIGSRNRGSGVVIADGAVLTNAHNLRGREVTVRFADGRTTRGTLAGVDWDGDLAVIAVDTAGATPIAWSTGGATIGSAVFAAAATPSGAARVSFGFVSSVERAFRGPGGRRIGGQGVERTLRRAAGALDLVLVRDGRSRVHLGDVGGDEVALVPDDDGEVLGTGDAGGRDGVPEEAAAPDPVQHLGGG